MTKSPICGETESSIRDRLIGSWKLVSTEETLRDGSTRPFPQFGPNAKGFLLYHADGYMCAVLLNPDRPKSRDSVDTALDEKVASADGTFAYCGRYEIDLRRKEIVHLPEIATASGFVGSRQIRPYQFEGERLIFTDKEKGRSPVARWKIVWEKAH